MGKSHLHSFLYKVTLHILGLLFFRVSHLFFFLLIEALYMSGILPFNLEVYQLYLPCEDWTGLSGEEKGRKGITRLAME